jgi:hypothetical protein
MLARSQAKLTERQREALALLAGPASSVLLRGGSRSGKTFLLVRALVIRAMKAPGSRHAIFRLRRNQVRSTIRLDTLPKVMRLCFPELPFGKNEADLIATLPNGSQLVLAGLDDKERVEKILGTEFSRGRKRTSCQSGSVAPIVEATKLVRRPRERARPLQPPEPARGVVRGTARPCLHRRKRS